MKLKKTPVLLLLLALLGGGIVLIQEQTRPSLDSQQTQSDSGFNFQESDVAAFTLKTPDEILSFVRQRHTVVEPDPTPTSSPTATSSPAATSSPSSSTSAPTASPIPSPTTGSASSASPSPPSTTASPGKPNEKSQTPEKIGQETEKIDAQTAAGNQKTAQNSGSNAPSPAPTAPSPESTVKPTVKPAPAPTAEATNWEMRSPKVVPASDASVAFLLNLLTTAKPSKTFTAPRAKLADYGLDQPTAEIEITLQDQRTHRLVLGKPDFSRTSLYAQIDPPADATTKDVAIALLPIEFENAINRPLAEWQNLPAKSPAPSQSPKP
jgi:hypothetical protein